ncbi:YccJ family protein [Acetobacter oryzoeni]|uniref:Uncharacterized protein n=1 Tax=Acetobacter oryzoeni TaxID=2500548 RepID=A0A5B9GKW5_9PROT|nr:YccJ family protein [Acetobacter oryzoeni]MCP1202224.1 YccJ family protein [Acetobacter oryzoeni]QEE85954.1 hypothetical protein EOV40_009705 [Acetobacter oryzoeni]
MTHFSNEIRSFADSRETSYEIAQAIFDLFPGNEENVWEEPSDAQRTAIVSAAWEMADADEDSLIWGCEKFSRDA